MFPGAPWRSAAAAAAAAVSAASAAAAGAAACGSKPAPRAAPPLPGRPRSLLFAAAGLPIAGLALNYVASVAQGARVARGPELPLLAFGGTGTVAGCSSAGVLGQSVKFEFCGKPATFTPIYEAEPKGGNLASVNAGDYRLYVGGGAINRAFQQTLGLSSKNGYQRLHELMLKEAEASPGVLVEVPPSSEAAHIAREELGLIGCFARVPGGDPPPNRGAVGAVFIDVFAPDKRPLSEKNVAMVYVVGPKGAGLDRTPFLDAVHDLGANAVLTLGAYNAHAAGGVGRRSGEDESKPSEKKEEASMLPRIDVVQWCLVSGGVYRHDDASKVDVATATVQGMLFGGSVAESEGVAAGTEPLVVRFGYDEGAFEAAVRDILGG